MFSRTIDFSIGFQTLGFSITSGCTINAHTCLVSFLRRSTSSFSLKRSRLLAHELTHICICPSQDGEWHRSGHPAHLHVAQTTPMHPRLNAIPAIGCPSRSHLWQAPLSKILFGASKYSVASCQLCEPVIRIKKQCLKTFLKFALFFRSSLNTGSSVSSNWRALRCRRFSSSFNVSRNIL